MPTGWLYLNPLMYFSGLLIVHGDFNNSIIINFIKKISENMNSKNNKTQMVRLTFRLGSNLVTFGSRP